jgi:hypothetical protein
MQYLTQINRCLMSHGLGTLEEGAGLIAQLGYLVQDHDHFRQMLVACEPAERSSMYQALAPNLRFEAKPLDVYLSEAAEIAEARQWPIFDQATDRLREFKTPEIGIAQKALEQAIAKQHLTLTCAKCTRVEVFSGLRKADAVQTARQAGWTYDELGGGREICPTCPAVRES